MMNYDPRPYWERCPYPPRPPMNHTVHRDQYFYTILFLDNYFVQPPAPAPKGRSIYYKITPTFEEESPIYWDTENPNILVVNTSLHLPVTMEMWDNDNKPLLYAPIIKLQDNTLTIGQFNIQTLEHTIKITFPEGTKPGQDEVFTLGIKELVDFRLDIKDTSALETLEDFLAVPKVQLKGLAIVFRRNSLDGYFDLVADFDTTYFHTLDEEADVQYLVRKSSYKDVYFTTVHTDNLQDVLNLIDVNYYKVEYSWQDHKKYKDQYKDYAEKYGYR